ncbi:hypothetical protein HMPREF9946_03118 [Acetobacteraceae bacterium AT-5844]|nr:hypothetical protein HMPREF9946_03118 [Acetobacteraceae bacterium AT-5844]
MLTEAEIARLKKARAVSRTKALAEAAQIVEALIRVVERDNPGRSRGAVSQRGQAMTTALKIAADGIMRRRDEATHWMPLPEPPKEGA